MSMPEATWRCDRCGGMQPTSGEHRSMDAPYPAGWRRGAWETVANAQYDLCQRCSGDFTDWWGEGSRKQ